MLCKDRPKQALPLKRLRSAGDGGVALVFLQTTAQGTEAICQMCRKSNVSPKANVLCVTKILAYFTLFGSQCHKKAANFVKKLRRKREDGSVNPLVLLPTTGSA